MKSVLLAGLAAFALAGCATIAAVRDDASPRTKVASASSDFLLVQEGVKGYLLLPPCGATVLPTCKSAAVVTALQKGNAAASAALDSAETIVTTPGANASTLEAAAASALAAVQSLKATKSNYGVK